MGFLKNKDKKERLLLWKVLFLCVGLVTLVAVYIRYMDTRTIQAKLYRYDNGQRFDYSSPSEIVKTEKGPVLKNGEKEFLLDAAPVYYKDQERVFLPMVMGVYCPEEKKFKKLAYFTEIYKSGNSIFVQNGGQKIPLDDGFLYNGLDLYLFVKKTTVKWNNRVFVLEPLSYAVVTYNKRLELYPYQGGGSIHEDTGDCEVMAETQSGFSINLSMDILRRADGIEQLLFFQPSSLKKME